MALGPWELEFTSAGYLLMPADLATQLFPNDTLVVTQKDRELWLLPTRGVAAGGLLLKQRNAAGDRALLLAPSLPEETPAGSWPAFWDAKQAALRVAWQTTQPALAAAAVVVHEQGRWVVYLEVGFWEHGDPGSPVRTERKRIADYATEQSARVAARWIERAADRNLSRPQLGF